MRFDDLRYMHNSVSLIRNTFAIASHVGRCIAGSIAAGQSEKLHEKYIHRLTDWPNIGKEQIGDWFLVSQLLTTANADIAVSVVARDDNAAQLCPIMKRCKVEF